MPDVRDMPHAPQPLADLMAQREALRAAEGARGSTIEGIMARVSAEVTHEAEERRAAEAQRAQVRPA